MILEALFALQVMDGANSYTRDTFSDFPSCVVAAQSEVEDGLQWQCVPVAGDDDKQQDNDKSDDDQNDKSDH